MALIGLELTLEMLGVFTHLQHHAHIIRATVTLFIVSDHSSSPQEYFTDLISDVLLKFIFLFLLTSFFIRP